MLITFFALLGCNNGSTLDGLDYDEQIAAPINLVISDKVLSWDVVADASGYYVFIDGKKVDTVKKNSYDFSKKDGDRLIFTVVTKAPRGMQDSVHSVTIGYIKNKTQEIASMKIAVANSLLTLGDDFATELVNKGMLTSEYTAMMDAFEDAAENSLQDALDISDYYEVIDSLMGTIKQPEALVSALVRHVLPNQLNDQIEIINEDLTYYQSMLDDPYVWNKSYYEERVAELTNEKTALLEVIDMIEDSPDHVVATIMMVIDYLMEFESLVSDNFINYITNLSKTNTLGAINVAEVVAIKEELVLILRETMPSQQDIVLATQTIYSMSDVFESMYDTSLGTLQYPEKMAATMMMSMEAYINYLDFLDADFFQELKDISNSDVSEYHMYANIAILGITYFEAYKDKYQALFDDIRDIYTDAEKEVLYAENITMAEELMSSEPMMPSIDFPTFKKMLALDAIFQDAFDELLDAFVESEGSLLVSIADLLDYQDEFDNNGFNSNSYNFYSTVYSMKIIDQVVYLINSVASERSQSEFVEVRDFVVEIVTEITLLNMGGDFSSAETQDIKDAIDAFMSDTKGAQHDLVQSVAKYLDKNDTFLDYADLYKATYQSNLTKLNEEKDYFNIIFIMGVFDDYMTSGNRADVDKLISELADILDVQALKDLQDMTYLPDALDEALDYIDSVAKEIGGINPATLTTTQKNRIEDVIEHIQSLLELPEN